MIWMTSMMIWIINQGFRSYQVMLAMEQVVMKQELDEEDLKQATGGTSHSRGINLTGKTEGYMCYEDGYCNKHITRYGINKCRNKTIQV